MPTSPEKTLQRLRGRLLAQGLAERVGAALLLAAGCGLLLATAARLGAGSLWQPAVLCGVPAVLLFAALVRAVARRPSLTAVAALVDRRGGTRDRYLTALAFAGAEEAQPLRMAARRECEAFIATDRPERHFPWRVPRAWPALPIVLIALALVRWETHTHESARRAAEAVAKAEVAPTVHALQQLAKQVEAEAKRDEALKRLAGQIAQGAAELHQQAKDPATAQASALRELSTLEQMAQSMASIPSSSSISPEERKALAEALAKLPQNQPAAEKMSAGETEAAAKALEEAAQKADTSQQAAAALQQALDHLAEQQKLSQAMEQLRQQLAQAGAEPSAALQKLAQMLRSSAAQNGSSNPSPGSSQTLQRMVAALQNMKSSETGAGKTSEGGAADEKDSGTRTAEHPNGPSREAELALLPGASGLPGTEKDPDFSSNPLGKTRQEAAAKGADLSLHGMQSTQGQAFSQLLPGAADATRARRQYKELYDSLAPAAEDAVLQEEIPLGSRLLLRRYFEAIRPRE